MWQNTDKYKEGEVVANHVFPISSVRIFFLERALTALHSMHYQQQKVTAMLPR
jgi:hypothetical protein